MAPIEEWQANAIAALDFLGGDWQITDEGYLTLGDGGESPGWLIWSWGERITLQWGCIEFECDVLGSDYASTTRRLLAAVKAWEQDPRGDDGPNIPR